MSVACPENYIELPYHPRPYWEKTLHPALDKYRWSIIVAHRRFGKTTGTVNQMIKRAIQNTRYEAPTYAYIAPFLKQAKMIAWDELKKSVSSIPGIKTNESELWVELPSYYENIRGARIYLFGADNPDNLRGTSLDGVIIDEYAQIKEELFGQILVPALTDRNGWCIFIGTPKGQNHFYDLYLKHLDSPDWYVTVLTVDDTGVLSPQQILKMKETMTEMEQRQELYCDWNVAAFNKLIDMELVSKAMSKDENDVTKAEYEKQPKVVGVDVARFGDDSSVIFMRQGLWASEPVVLKHIDNMTLAGRIAEFIDKERPAKVFIDSGRGEGVIDRLKQLGYEDLIWEVPFGGKAIKDTRFVNKRSEMWYACKEWLESGGVLPYLPKLRTDLTMPEYTYDAMNRIKLQTKKDIKAKTGSSPDIADALCLTFAYPVNLSRQRLYKRARRAGTLHKYGRL